MENMETKVTALESRVELLFKLIGHCKVEVPSDPRKTMELMKTAYDLGGMDQLVEQCIQSIESSLDDTCAIEIYKFALSRSWCSRLEDRSFQYILENFMSVQNHEDLLTLDMSDLQAILWADQLYVTSERVVAETVFRWVRHDVDSRKQDVDFLILKCVRLYCCEPSYLTYLKDHHLLYDKRYLQGQLQMVLQEMEAGWPLLAEKRESSKRRRNQQH